MDFCANLQAAKSISWEETWNLQSASASGEQGRDHLCPAIGPACKIAPACNSAIGTARQASPCAAWRLVHANRFLPSLFA
jgi:hypothetical protein